MIERVSCESVTFLDPFFVLGLGCEVPAGTYEIETVEELIEGLSFLAYHVISTSIRIPPSTSSSMRCYQVALIEPSVVCSALTSRDEE